MKIDFDLVEERADDDSKSAQIVPAGKGMIDIERVKASFKEFERQIDQVKSAIDGFDIKTDDDAASFTETVGAVKRLAKAMKSKQDSIIKEADSWVKQVKAFVKKYISQLDALEKTGKGKIGQYNYKKEIERREREKKMQEEAARRQAEIDAAAKKAGVDSIVLPPIVTPEKVTPIRTESAVGSTRYKKYPKVIDFSILPDDYKMVNEKKLQDAIDAGLRPPGVEIEERPIVSIRTN